MRWLLYVTAAVLTVGISMLRGFGCTNAVSASAGQPSVSSTARVSVASAVASSPPPLSSALAAPTFMQRDFELRDWFAFGSGCHSRPTLPGDVGIHISEVSRTPGLYRVTLTLPDYGIVPTDPLFLTAPSFARECGIRLAIYPNAGKKLVRVATQPVYHVEKPEGPRVRLRARLFSGDTLLSRFEQWFDGQQVVLAQKQSVNWQAETRGHSVFERMRCEQPRIVGLDVSVALVREDLSPYQVTIVLNHRSLEMMLQFSDCGPPNYSQSAENRNLTQAEALSEERDAQ